MRSKFLIPLSFLMIPMMGWAAPEVAVKKQICPGGATYPVHLSFDDGPKIPETEKVLDFLKKNNIKATFLITLTRFDAMLKGPPTAQNKKLIALIERMKAEGHIVGSHSFEHMEHANLKVYTPDEIQTNLNKAFHIANQLNLSKPTPFRFPYGSGWFSEPDPANQGMANKVMREVKSMGYRPFHWDIDTWDWSKIKRKALPDSVLEQICNHGGGVVLMHDIHSWTVENLPAIVASIKESGHTLVSNSEITKYSNSDPKGPLVSLEDKAAGIRECKKRIGDLDQVSATCDTYPSNKSTGSRSGVE